MVAIIIIVLTCIVSIPAFSNRYFFYRFDFAPHSVEERKEYYRFVTHAFLHADWTHLFFNMFVLYTFGRATQEYFENYLGSIGIFYFVLLYFGGIIFAVVPTYRKEKNNPSYHSIGASGAVSAVLFSYIIFSPSTELTLLIFPFFGLPSIVWGIAYLAYEQYSSRKNISNINHDAHIAGAIFGIVFTLITVPKSLSSFIDQITYLLKF
ncbi:MAG: membrane associated rhomboid family serine protease [Vicingaceae bacterium]|jgi:membrane associated rhomboid family serine protease